MLLTKVQKNIRNCLTYVQDGKHEDQAPVSAFTILVSQTCTACLFQTYGANSLCLQHTWSTTDSTHPTINFCRL